MKKSFWVPFLALVSSLMFSITALAGEVNSAEQKIIDAISGTYEYDGAQYRVTDAYIAKVTAYLSRDDVNMTDGEARGYIRQFNANIAVGISSGYMVKVEDAGDSEQPPEEPDTETGDGTDEGEIDKDDGEKDDTDKDNELDTDKDKDKNTGTGDSSKGSGSGNKGNGNSTTGEDKKNSDSSVTGSNTTNGNSTVGGNKGTGNSSTAGKNTGVDNGITAGDLGIGMMTPDGNALSGFFSPAETGAETGVIEDNTIGSTTDGEIEYSVFPIDRTTMYVWDIDTLDVHVEAYKDSDVIGTLNKGDAVTITGAATTGWAQIDYNGETGYVSAVYLRTQTYMSTVEESEITDNEAGSKDYSDAAPLKKSFNFGTIAVVIIILCIIGSGIIIIWHRNKSRKR